MLENMDDFTIPARYNPVIEHFKGKGQFEYLDFDGRRFKVPVERLMDLYRDLKSDMPDDETVRKLTMGTGTHWELWDRDMEDEELSMVKESLIPERMEALILEEEQIVEQEAEKEDPELKARIIGAILYMLIILLLSLVFFLIPMGPSGTLGNPFDLLDVLGIAEKK